MTVEACAVPLPRPTTRQDKLMGGRAGKRDGTGFFNNQSAASSLGFSCAQFEVSGSTLPLIANVGVPVSP